MVKFLKEKAQEVMVTNDNLGGCRRVWERVETHISWQKPAHGWIKLNTDGASRGNPGLATAGGDMRDEYGVRHGDFALAIGICFGVVGSILWIMHSIGSWLSSVRAGSGFGDCGGFSSDRD